MSNSATLWTVAHQAPLSVGFSRQEYWSGLPCPPPGDIPNPGMEPASLMSPTSNHFRNTLVFSFKRCQKLTITAFQVVLVVKNPPANARDVRDTGSIPGWERSPRGGHGNPLQYSCLENPMGRGAWRATVHEVTVRHS